MFDMSDFAGSVSGIAAGIQADLSAAAALSGVSQAAAGQFQIDLAAVYKHYNDVADIYDQLAKKIVDLQSRGQQHLQAQTAEIPGVYDAFINTWASAIGGSDSMVSGMQVVLGVIGKYTNAIGDAYLSYLKADSAGATTLTAAGNPDAAAVVIP